MNGLDNEMSVLDVLYLVVDGSGLFPHCEDRRDVVARLQGALLREPLCVRDVDALREAALQERETVTALFSRVAGREGRVLAGRLGALCNSDERRERYDEWVDAKMRKSARQRQRQAAERARKDAEKQSRIAEGQDTWHAFCSAARQADRKRHSGDPYLNTPLQITQLSEPTPTLQTTISSAIEALGHSIDPIEAKRVLTQIGYQLIDAKIVGLPELSVLVLQEEGKALALLEKACPEHCRVLLGALRRILRAEETSERYAEWYDDKEKRSAEQAAIRRTERALQTQRAARSAAHNQEVAAAAFTKFRKTHPVTPAWCRHTIHTAPPTGGTTIGNITTAPPESFREEESREEAKQPRPFEDFELMDELKFQPYVHVL